MTDGVALSTRFGVSKCACAVVRRTRGDCCAPRAAGVPAGVDVPRYLQYVADGNPGRRPPVFREMYCRFRRSAATSVFIHAKLIARVVGWTNRLPSAR
jgi:hypothetical protein